ncbi:uncharacterized protein BHQ10_003710 [Talaromyces amestolkiae]|uniref:Uncharacterized protein n=1 Tax=Talaromyces amestolkiae TaxID=1196081 RepID=A0A364KVX0_TALAM|nr:uncharacterized protein BHQ10_003710 [Talaromyces amestolkiae]RAO67698.1 hypothetical protein BHQ10_003710 [Talaromyces amestolkiae]
MASPFRPYHWPRGIPPEVRPHPNGDITPAEANEEAKASIPDHDGDYELRQRRTLVETWAKADQELRDSYHQRAPVRDALAYPEPALRNVHKFYPPYARFMCLAPLGPSYRSNLSKWIKLYILSCRLDGEMGHCLLVDSHIGVDPNPATFPDPSTFQITDVLPWMFLETANFNTITMTCRGTVLFMNQLRTWFLVNQDDLDTGRITTVEFKLNGEIADSLRRRAYNMFPVSLALCVGYDPLWEVRERRVGGYLPDQNAALDMTLPVIDILEGAKLRGEFLQHFDGARDVWTEDIERYAPGYLQMEAEGNEADYDHERLMDPDEA